MRVASDFVVAHRGAPRARPEPGPAPAAHVRRRRLRDGESRVGPHAVRSAAVLDALVSTPHARTDAARGLRTLLLAGWARQLGLQVTIAERLAAERSWLRSRGGRARQSVLAASALDEAEVARIAEDLALEAKVLLHADRILGDGPSSEEGLAFHARVTGEWALVARALARESRAKGRARGQPRGRRQ